MASPREGRINGGTRSQQQSPLIRRARSGSSQRSRQTAGTPGRGGGRRRTREFPTEATQGQDAPERPQPPAPAFLRPRGRSRVSRALAGPSWKRRGETKATLMARSAIGPAGDYEDITRETFPQGNRSREVRRTTKGDQRSPSPSPSNAQKLPRLGPPVVTNNGKQVPVHNISTKFPGGVL